MPVPAVPRFQPTLTPSDFAAICGGLAEPGRAEAQTAEFERRFARMLGVAHVVTTSSARAALYLVLKHAGLPAGGEVLVPALTYWSMPAAVVRAGFRPVFVDVGPRTYLIDPARIEAALTARTCAILPTHLYGCPCEMEAILDLARRRGLMVIEDCAQSCGARYGFKRTGSLGDAAVFTFGLLKNFTTLVGGAVATNRADLAGAIRDEVRTFARTRAGEIARLAAVALAMWASTRRAVFDVTLRPLLRRSGREGGDVIDRRGYEAPTLQVDRPVGRWHAAQAAMGLRQLAGLDGHNAVRARNGRCLAAALAGTPGLGLPSIPDPAEREHIFMSFVVRARERDRFRRALLDRGVDTAAGYMRNCAASPLFGRFAADCPVASAVEAEQVHLPVYPGLSPADLSAVARDVRAALRQVQGRGA